jgi:hypothetical protein
LTESKAVPLNVNGPEPEESPFIDECDACDDELGATEIAPKADELLPVKADVSAPVVALDGSLAS